MAQSYLTSRGFSAETAKHWQLGYVLDPLPGHERMKGRLAIPYLTPAGPVHIKFRCIQDHVCDEHGHKKYDSEAGHPTRMFGVQSFQADSTFICLTEGELDTIAAGVAGLPSVAIPGVKTWKPHMRYCFEGYDEVIVLQDGDSAGSKLGDSVMRDVHTVRIVQMPEGSDVNQYLVDHGPKALRERVGVR